MRTFGTKKAFFGGPAAFFSKQNEQKNRKSSFSRIFDRILSNLTILFGLKGSFCQGPDSSETAAFFGPEGAKSVALGSDFNKKRGAGRGLKERKVDFFKNFSFIFFQKRNHVTKPKTGNEISSRLLWRNVRVFPKRPILSATVPTRVFRRKRGEKEQYNKKRGAPRLEKLRRASNFHCFFERKATSVLELEKLAF